MKKLIPGFKFLAQEHADKLLNEGNMFIPNMSHFTNKESNVGSLYDTEGSFNIENTYKNNLNTHDRCYGLLQVLPMLYGTYIVKEKVSQRFDLPAANIYCFGRYFFSETLYFAISTNKNSCVFITDIESFTNAAAKGIADARLVILGECIYSGRNINEINPGPNSNTHKFITDIKSGKGINYLIKPNSWEYREQHEARSVWFRHDRQNTDINVTVPELAKFCIKIEFSDLYSAIRRGYRINELLIGIIVNYKSGNRQPVVLNTSVFTWTPEVRVEDNGESYLYFVPLHNNATTPNTFQGGHYKVGMILGDNGVSLGPIPLDEIESIEYSLAETEETFIIHPGEN